MDIDKLYRTARWKRTRLEVFIRDAFACRSCGRGVVGDWPNANAPVCDHIELAVEIVALEGEEAFFDPDRCQTLCNECHNRVKQSAEKIGYSKQVGTDGWPLDPRHPTNR